MDNGLIDIVKGTPNILGQVYTDLAQPGVKAVGQALGTVLEFSTSFLLPVKLLNEKFKLNFTKRLNEYKEKLEEIPEEKRCEVHPQIGTPIVEKLTYTTNDEIADLFTTLLASASNTDSVNAAHPSFVNMIERLSPDEARIIKYLKHEDDIQYCNFNGYAKNGNGFNTLLDHATLLPFQVKMDFPQNVNAYLANLTSLGVLLDLDGTYKIEQSTYDKIKQQYGYENLVEKLVPNVYKNLDCDRAYYKITDFGKLFIKACIK